MGHGEERNSHPLATCGLEKQGDAGISSTFMELEQGAPSMGPEKMPSICQSLNLNSTPQRKQIPFAHQL